MGQPPGLEITSSSQGCCLVLALVGELDMATAHLFREATDPLDPSTRHVMIDASQLEFVDSSGIKVWMELALRLSERLAVVNPSEHLKKLLEITGTDSFTLWDSQEEAQSHFHSLE